MTPSATYVGDELDVFASARNWKAYWSRMLTPLVHGRVLEVGAGIGASTRALATPRATNWLCLEPDPALAARIVEVHRREPFPIPVEVRVGTIETVESSVPFDCILYVDVLEHIRDDDAELQRAAALLRPGGVLVVLAPAHQRFFSAFDRSIGHYRRYDEPMLRAITPAGVDLERVFHLDSTGMLLSWLNRHVRRAGTPGRWPVLVWDRVFIPASRLVDPLLGYRRGKTVVGIWRRPLG